MAEALFPRYMTAKTPRNCAKNFSLKAIVCCDRIFQVAPLISWPLSTLLFVLSYKLPFLIQSSLTITLSVIWYICYREKPQYHPVVNGLELNKIVAGKIKVGFEIKSLWKL